MFTTKPTNIGNLFKYIGIAIILNVLIKPTGIFVENIVQDHLGHVAYGTFAALNALAFLFLVFLDFGINQFLTKELAVNPAMPSENLSGLFSLKLFLAIAYPFLMLGVGYLLGYSAHNVYLLFIISSGYSCIQISLYFRAKFQALQKFKLEAFASVADKLILIILTVILIIINININDYILIRFLSMFLTMVILIVPAWKIFSKEAFVVNIDLETWKNTLKQTYPFALITILYSIHDKVDQVMIERLIGQYQSGLYAAAYRWIDAFMMYLWIVLPMFFARFSFVKNDPEQLKSVLKSAQVIAAIPLLFVSAFVCFHGEQLFILLTNSTPAEVIEMTSCLKVLFIAVLIHAYFAIFGTLLTAIGGEFFLNKMMIFTITLNIVLNIYFIKHFGISGAAWATAISTFFLSVSYIFKLLKNPVFHLDIALITKLICLGVLLYASFYICQLLQYNWWVSSIFTGMLMAFFVFTSGLFKLLVKQ